jgi:MFS transporter, DHA1 family, inner membrane transport protein
MRSTPSPARANLALGALFGGTFVLGSAELVIVGVLDAVARDLSVPISTAGTLVTAYALGIAVGGPLLTAVTIRIRRRLLLCLSLAAYLVVTVLAIAAADFGMLLVARVATGCLQGLFIGVAFAVATALVPRERMGRAIAVVIGGIAVSAAFGVPLGTLIGQTLGWRGTFVAVLGFGLAALVAMLVAVPPVEGAGPDGLRAQAPYALAPRVLAVLAVGFLLLGGQYAALTYITPFLEATTGVSGPAISLYLLAFGVATAVGTFAGGWAADRSATRTLILANAVLVVALGALWLAGAVPAAVAAVLCVWGVAGFGLVPSLQYRVISLAGPGRDLAETLPASAVNAGIAVGAVVGGIGVAARGPSTAVVAGLVICGAALPATWGIRFLHAPRVPIGGG